MAQRFFKHRRQLFRFLREETGSVGFVRIRREQGRAARTERTIKNHFDRALRETVIECIQGRAIFQQCVGGFTGAVSGIEHAQFHFSGGVGAPDDFLIRQLTAGVLNFAPAEFDLAIDALEQRLLGLSFGRLGNIFRDQIHRIIEQHSVWIAVRFQNLSAEWIGGVIVDVGDFSAAEFTTAA